MKFLKTNIPEVFLIQPEPFADERGSFFRAFCAAEFELHGLEAKYIQSNISTNKLMGTVRGMHFQKSPDAEVKIVRCISGVIYDVVVDVRKDSPTYLKSFSAELSESNGMMMYVPKGFAHGYQTLSDFSAVHYMVSNRYSPVSECGLRYNDPAININWPLPMISISNKDANWPPIGAQ
jgi:dTDP-4-dehydrorhamnose 3,5-epimerase